MLLMGLLRCTCGEQKTVVTFDLSHINIGRVDEHELLRVFHQLLLPPSSRLPRYAATGISKEPKKPPFCIISFFFFKLVFFLVTNRSFSLCLQRSEVCFDVNGTFPFNKFAQHSEMQSTIFRLLLHINVLRALGVARERMHTFSKVFSSFFSFIFPRFMSVGN